MNFMTVPKYSEISAENLYNFVQEWDDLKEHFSDIEFEKLRDFRFLNQKIKLIEIQQDEEAYQRGSDISTHQ